MKTNDPTFALEADAIQAVIADYFGGIYHGDLDRLRRVFHPRATLHGDVNGQSYFRQLDDYLEVVRQRQSPAALGEPFCMKVLSLEIVNGIAIARLSVPMLGFHYHDLVALHKT